MQNLLYSLLLPPLRGPPRRLLATSRRLAAYTRRREAKVVYRLNFSGRLTRKCEQRARGFCRFLPMYALTCRDRRPRRSMYEVLTKLNREIKRKENKRFMWIGFVRFWTVEDAGPYGCEHRARGHVFSKCTHQFFSPPPRGEVRLAPGGVRVHDGCALVIYL